MKPEELFIRQSVSYARSLPLPDCVGYLRGLLLACGENDMTHPVRDIFVNLSHCDAQLELISSGQMELGLPDNNQPSPLGNGPIEPGQPPVGI